MYTLLQLVHVVINQPKCGAHHSTISPGGVVIDVSSAVDIDFSPTPEVSPQAIAPAGAAVPEVSPRGDQILRPRGVPICLELCCGSARLSRALSEVGFRTIGIDYHFNKSIPEAFVIGIDLGAAEGQSLAWKWFHHPALFFAWWAPPCGTSTRAREKPGGPPPLRTDQHPDGIPGLAGRDAVRVAKANAVYAFCVNTCLY